MKNNRIEKPIFIIGPGRSGTSIFYNLLSIHSDLFWFSNISDRFPNLKILAACQRILDLPVIGLSLKKRVLTKKRGKIRPVEAGNIYHELCQFEYKRKTIESDLGSLTEERFKEFIRSHARYTGKNRFISKQTANNQRIRLISSLFKDAYFIHVIRDGRAVANSLKNVRWWNNTHLWWLESRFSDIEDTSDSVKYCALHWLHDIEEIQNNKYLFNDRYLEIKYEDLVIDVKKVMRQAIDFCELEHDPTYYDLLPSTLPNMNEKWMRDLSEDEKQVVNSVLGTKLQSLGYM